MHRPQQRRRQCQRQSHLAESFAQNRPQQRPAHDAKENQPGKNVDDEIQRVVTPHRRAADGIIDGQ
jgi:hypothetical protein